MDVGQKSEDGSWDKGPSDQFRLAVRRAAEQRSLRDLESGVSRSDTLLPGQIQWQELHRLSRLFDSQVLPLIQAVVQSANAEMASYGFTLEPARMLRRLPGELNGVAYKIGSDRGIEPTGLLTFKLRDSGRVRIEVEGIMARITFSGTAHPRLDVSFDEFGSGHVEAALLSFVREVLGASQHAFAE